MKKPWKDKVKIEKKHLVLCEGIDDERFLCEFLESFLKENFAVIQVINVDGIDNMRMAIELLSKDKEFENLKSLIIVRDSDDNPKGASESVQGALKKFGLPVPSRPCQIKHSDESCAGVRLSVGYALFPKFNQEHAAGTLENLCLDTLGDKEGVNKDAILNIVDESIKKAESINGLFTHEHKNRLHTYFSLSNEFVGNKIGEAASSKAFDFSASAYAPLKDIVEQMLAE